eukprot:1027842-Pyramimonas_sp.AAC.1
MGHHASKWRDQELHVAICDIRRAFDNATVGKLREALQWSQVPLPFQIPLLEAVLYGSCEVTVQGLHIEGFFWDVNITTGGPAGPLDFNLIAAHMWGATFHTWDVLGYGYTCEIVGEKLEYDGAAYGQP